MRQNQYPQRTVYRSATVVRHGTPTTLLTATGILTVNLSPIVLRTSIPVILVSPITVSLQPVALRGAIPTTTFQRTFTLSPVSLRASLPTTTFRRELPLLPIAARLALPTTSFLGLGELVQLRYRPRWLMNLVISGTTKYYSSEDFDANVSVFSPTALPGLLLWLEADVGLYEDAAKAVPATDDGDAVYTWADQSGNGRDAVQATLSKRPLLKLAIQNGKPAVRFDGVNDALTLSLALTDTYSIFIVLRPIPSSDNYGTVFSEGIVRGYWYRGGTKKMSHWFTVDHLNNTALVENAANLYGAIVQLGNETFYVNALADGTATLAPAATYDSIGDDSLSDTYKGDLLALLVYDSALSTANRQAVETYLNTKYGIY